MLTLSWMFFSAKMTPGFRPERRVGGNDGMHAVGQMLEVAVGP